MMPFEELTKQFASLYESIPAGILFVDRQTGKPIYANPLAKALLGQHDIIPAPEGEYVRTYELEREDGTRYPHDELPIQRVMSTGQPTHRDDLFIRRSDGSRIQLEVWASPFQSDTVTHVDAVVLLLQDITQRKTAEKTLEREQEFLRALVTNLNEGVVACDRNGQLILLRRTRQSPCEPPQPPVPPEQWAEHFGLYTADGKRLMKMEEVPLYRAWKGETLVAEEMVLRRTDGEELHVMVSGSPIRSAAGELLGAVCVDHDIAILRKAQEQAQRLAAIVAHSSDAIIGLNPEGDITSWNRGAETVFGYLPDQVVGRHCDCLFPKSALGRFQQVLTQARTGQETTHFDTLCSTATGKMRYVELNLSCIYDDAGHVRAISMIVRDMTHQRQIQEQLYRDERMRSVATLAGGVAHDFNNILVSVMGNASLIQSEISDGHPWQRPINAIIDSAERAAAITRQLLAYARGGVYSPRPHSLKTMIEDSLHLCRSVVGNQVTIEFTPQTQSDGIEADPTQIQQILLNLIINASEAMPGGGRVLIRIFLTTGPSNSVLADKNCVALSIADEGSGVEPSVADRIFEPFVTTKAIGRGLGLASVYGMVKNHHAEIRLVPQSLPGAEFVIYFPKIESDPIPIPPT